MKHTPGPLKVTYSPIGVNGTDLTMGYHIKTDDDVERVIATLWEGGGTKGKPTQRANAHVFKAAPDMLEALEEIEKGVGAFSTDPLTHAGNTIENMKSIATEAIRKAKEG